MLKQHLAAASFIALAAAGAQAETWNFEYKGFYNAATDTFDPNHVVRGAFEGSDLNNNSIIELDELTQLTADGYSYFGCPTELYVFCTVRSFTYTANGNLSFSANHSYTDEFSGGSGGAITTGDRVTSYWYRGENEGSTDWRWTGQTTFTISPPPVPEPSTFAMLGLGGLLLGARQWRARRAR